MADVGAWSAAATATLAAIGAVISAARQPADVATLRGEVKAAKDEAPAAVKAAVDAVRAALDESIGKVAANLASVAKRVGDLESWRRTLHERSQAETTGRNMIASGSDLAAQVDKEHERRIVALEADARTTAATLTDARLVLARIEGNIGNALRGKGER